MKLSEFNDLCWREWGKPRRGDVVSVSLTEASAEELKLDALMRLRQFLTEDDLRRPLSWVINPVTRSTVKIRVKDGGTRETARVRVMGGTCRETWWPATA